MAVLPGKIKFVAYHQPALDDGIYTLTVSPEMTVDGTIRVDKTKGKIVKKFQVSGPRFSLPPKEVHSVFPPAGNLGDYDNVLPHIILNRTTLPWERFAVSENKEIPFLALLVFDGSGEIPKPLVVTLGELQKTKNYPKFEYEVGQKSTDKVSVIDVDKSLLKKVMPLKSDLTNLCHVRQALDINGGTSDEYAVVIANRLPKAGGMTAVHLVSLEKRFTEDIIEMSYLGATNDETVRLVSLYSWRFSSLTPDQSLSGILQKLNSNPKNQDSMLRLPLPKDNKNPDLNAYFEQGFVPLSHLTRNGEKAVSWFHGPLATGNNPNQMESIIHKTSDELLEFHSKIGMFDVSYAAAWELGRLLLLQNKRISQSLYNWKRSMDQYRKAELQFNHPPLKGFYGSDNKEPEIPDNIDLWYADLVMLKGMPLSYLVPDNRMLPVESIKFFTLDFNWIVCLLEGAFNAVGITSSDLNDDSSQFSKFVKPVAEEENSDIYSGFLMRSSAVSGWPGLEIEAYKTQDTYRISKESEAALIAKPEHATNILSNLKKHFKTDKLNYTTDIDKQQWTVHNLESDEQFIIRQKNRIFTVGSKCKLLRRDTLSPNVMICIFEGQLDEVDIFQKPETLHFGVDRNNPGATGYHKILKDKTGKKSNKIITDLPFKDKDAGILDISKLAANIKNTLNWDFVDSALFAIEMTEGVDRIKFMR